jgi:ABC-type uncharacterized transport system substrate-binding protein
LRRVSLVKPDTNGAATSSSPKDPQFAQMMEFSDNDVEEEKEELSDELVVALKQKITTSKKQVAELHLAVYDQKYYFGVLIRPPLAS